MLRADVLEEKIPAEERVSLIQWDTGPRACAFGMAATDREFLSQPDRQIRIRTEHEARVFRVRRPDLLIINIGLIKRCYSFVELS